MTHPALQPGHVAVITGAASGIGLSTAKQFAGMGLRVVLADLQGEALGHAAAEVAAVARGGATDVLAVPTDVSDMAQVEQLRDAAFDTFGAVHVLMNNAGMSPGGGPYENHAAWQRLLAVNLFGVINGVQAFSQRMIDQGAPGAIICTGSKQGITCPPGNTAYNVSKAGVKVLAEALAHQLRSVEGCQITAHLLIPGSTFTGMTRRNHAEKPPGAWAPEQVTDMLVDSMGKGDFYILCPDNEVTPQIDHRRILWAAGDIVHNRPALSRWHKDHAAGFAAFLESGKTG